MRHTPVRSSTLRSVGYDHATGTLEIEFQRGGTYAYVGVPEFLYKGLMLAVSKGRFFNERIATRYQSRRVR